MPTLVVPLPASLALADAYDRVFPSETCGFLLGRQEGSTMSVVEVRPARSAGLARDGFEIPEHEMRQAFDYARASRQHILALFHSHPSGNGALSDTDRAALRYSAFPWLIVTRRPGVAGLTLTCFASRTCAPIRVRGQSS